MGSVALAIVLLAASPASAASGQMPKSPSEYYAAGETFAHCSAHFTFAGDLARSQGMSESATAFDDMARGWRLAGLFLLVGGVESGREATVEQLFDDLAATQMGQLRAVREMHPGGYSTLVTAKFQDECGPWTELQKSIIAAMRRTPTPQ